MQSSLTKDGVAKAFGVSARTVVRWARAGCPCERQGPRNAYAFNLGAVTAWHNERKGAVVDDEIAQARRKWERARAGLAELRRQREAKEVHSVATCQRRRLRQIQATKAAFLGLPRSVAGELMGKDREEIASLLLLRIEGILEGFAHDAGHQDVE